MIFKENILKPLFLAVFFIFLTGCVATNKKSESAALASPQLLSEKEDQAQKTCVAVFKNENRLLIVTRFPDYLSKSYDLSLHYLSVYDPVTGVFASYSRNDPKAKKCSDVDVYAQHRTIWVEVNGIRSVEFRRVLDGAFENPKGLVDAITANPPHFRYDGKYMGEMVYERLTGLNVVDFKSENPSGMRRIASRTLINGIEGLNMALSSLTVSDVELLWKASRQRDRERIYQGQILQEKERQYAKPWNERKAVVYSIGDKVCTHKENLFGYIDLVNKNKIKVHVVGRVETLDGYFFSSLREIGLEYRRIEAMRWLDTDEVAPCQFRP